MCRYKFVPIFLILNLMAIVQTIEAEPTARTYSFAAFQAYYTTPGAIDSLAKHFDLVYAPESIRFWNHIFRDSTQVMWRRDKPPLLLVYKDALTLCGPGYPYGPPDSPHGGGQSVGGFMHFDSIFFGYKPYKSDTCFMMTTPQNDSFGHHDIYGRVQAGSVLSWQWRWAMDYGKPYWQNFHACSTKVQCLRNYKDLIYDETYFDGVFIDNLLMWRNDYGMYPDQYQTHESFREAVYSFAQAVSSEYHNADTPPEHSCQILAVGNLNFAYSTPNYDSIWKIYLGCLDGGQEETYFAHDTLNFDTWRKFIHEIAIAESLGKICIVKKAVECDPLGPAPFNIGPYDTNSMIFGFASYLMAYDSMTHFGFSSDSAGREYAHIYWAPILDIDLGKPMCAYIIDTTESDTFVYRYFEEGMVFANPRFESPSITGFAGDTLYEIGPFCDIIDTLKGQFTLDDHKSKICLYPLNYFQSSSFEPDDRLCWENYCLGAQGIINYGAERVYRDEPNGVMPHSGHWMYKVFGEDVSADTSYIIFKVFPYDILIGDSTYFSFWINVYDAPGNLAPIGIDCLLKSGGRLSKWTKFGYILDQYGNEVSPAGRRVPKGVWLQYVFTFAPAVAETIDHIELVYDGSQVSETGSFCAYIDDIEIATQFLILDTWHCEKFPVGSPFNNPNNYDPNFYLNFTA